MNNYLIFFRYYLIIRVTRLKFKTYQVGFLYIIFTKQLWFSSLRAVTQGEEKPLP